MPSGYRKHSKFTKPRDYDRESGKNRVQDKKKSKLPPVDDSSSASELSASESEIESEYDIKIKDVHRQSIHPSRPRRVQAQQDSKNVEHGDEPLKDDNTVAPSANLLVAIAYRQGTSAVQFEQRSFYIPDCSALFAAAYSICDLLTPNSLVHEIDPSFTSITFYLYVAHLFYYHVLRVRDSTGELTREERRCLRHYENVGPAESWPVPTPMIAIIESYGMVSPPSKFYGKIIPALPSFTGLSDNHSLRNFSSVHGVQRVPCVPAMQQFVHNFGNNIADFDADILYPLANPALSPGAAGPPAIQVNAFLGLTDSSPNGEIQTLFFNSGWIQPTEASSELTNYTYELKRSLTARQQIPDIGNTATITGLESYLGFRDGQSKAWMKFLLRSSSTACRFFPGSSNLSAIGTTTQEELITQIDWNTPTPRTARNNHWYQSRDLFTYSFKGKVNTEQSGFLYKIASSASPNAQFNTSVLPSSNQASASAERTGPYFVNPTGSTSVPLTLVETNAQPDPIRNLLAFIDEQLYDHLGGRSRRDETTR